MKTDLTHFCRKTAVVLIFFFLYAMRMSGQSSISGNLQGTLTKANSPYILTSSITVPAGQTLTIEPGVEIRFPVSLGYFYVLGTLKADGTATDSIRFTGEGDRYPQTPFRAGPIFVGSSSVNTSFSYVNIDRFGSGSRSDLEYALFIASNSCTFRNSSFTNIQGSAIQLDSSGVQISNINFSTTNLDVIVSANNLQKVTGNGRIKIGLLPTFSTDVTFLRGNLYKLLGNMTIPQGKTLTIEPGVELQFGVNQSRLTIQGTLKAKGTVTDSITFTSFGNGTAAAQQFTGPIVIEATSTNSSLAFIKINGLGYGNPTDLLASLIIRSSTCTVQNCNLLNIQGTGIQLDKANPVISNNTFLTTNMDMLVIPDNLPSLTGNGNLKIGLQSAVTTLTTDPTFTKGNIYKLLGTLSIPAGRTLTVNPGTEVQFTYTKSILSVDGTLKAEGTATDSIRFTVAGDASDSYGNSGPLSFNAGSINCSLKYVKITGLGYGTTTDSSAAVIIRSSSASVQHSSFENIKGTGIYMDNAGPQITDNTFSTLNMDVILNPEFLRAISRNGPLKIGLMGFVNDATLTRNHLFYRLLRNVIIPQNKTLMMEPGVQVQFLWNKSQINIKGTLKAEGTVSDSIRFTGLGDFISGGNPYSPFQKGPIIFEATSTNSSLQYVSISGLGTYAAPTDESAVLTIGSSFSVIGHCSFTNIRGSGISLYIINPPLNDFRPQIISNTFSTTNQDVVVSIGNMVKLIDNGPLKIGLTGGNTVDARLSRVNTYTALSGFIVPKGTTLTIDPGVEIKYAPAITGLLMEIHGKVIAEGTATDSIKFTGVLSSDFNSAPVVRLLLKLQARILYFNM